jgi:quinol monooxygenase YgiN
MPIVAVADLFGVKARRQELLDLLVASERETAGASGCRRYAFAATIAEPDHFVLHSEWDDQARFDAHYGSQAFASFQFALNGLLARPSEMTVYSVDRVTRPVASGPMDPRDAD